MSFVNVPFVLLCVVFCAHARRQYVQSTELDVTAAPLGPSEVISRLAAVRDQQRTESKKTGYGHCPNAKQGSVTESEVSAIFRGTKPIPPAQNRPITIGDYKTYEGSFQLSPAAKKLYDEFSRMASSGQIAKQRVMHGTHGSYGGTMNPLKLAGIVGRKSKREKIDKIVESIASSGFTYASRAAAGPGVYTSSNAYTALKYTDRVIDHCHCGAVVTMELFGGQVDAGDKRVASFGHPTGNKNEPYFKPGQDWYVVCEPVMMFPVSYSIVESEVCMKETNATQRCAIV